MRIRAAAALLGCGIVLSAAGGIGPASARTGAVPALSLDSMSCTPQGAYVVECWATVSGGYPPYTYYWSNNPKDHSDDQTSMCTTGYPNWHQVNLTVYDSGGTYVTGTHYYACDGGFPH
jgi:hypothetical protein